MLLVFLYTWLLSQKFGSIEGTSIELNAFFFRYFVFFDFALQLHVKKHQFLLLLS